jgi:hypothetical protein
MSRFQQAPMSFVDDFGYIQNPTENVGDEWFFCYLASTFVHQFHSSCCQSSQRTFVRSERAEASGGRFCLSIMGVENIFEKSILRWVYDSETRIILWKNFGNVEYVISSVGRIHLQHHSSY